MTHHSTVSLSNSIYNQAGMVNNFRSQSNDSFTHILKALLLKLIKK